MARAQGVTPSERGDVDRSVAAIERLLAGEGESGPSPVGYTGSHAFCAVLLQGCCQVLSGGP
jgi:hypothetical protein